MTDDMELQEADGAGQALPPNARRLLRTVYIMAAVPVALMIVLAGAIVWKTTNRAPSKALESPVRYDLGLAADEVVTATAIDGDSLAVTTNRGIIIVNLRSHSIAARIGFRPQ